MAIVREAARWLGVWALAACSGGASHWDGRRGDYGRGDYGYDVAKSNAEAHSYRSRAPLYYAQPGDLNDPWGSYIREAADRFQIPEGWVRAVMQQESGGKLYGADGSLITSSAGAMGLMQVMPQTFDVLQQRYRLGSDPYEPRTNILAGAAYIREMYDRYGVPNFLAAYNAGPDRLDSYLNDGSPLPDETTGYMATVAPQLGLGIASERAYATGGMGGGADRLDGDPSTRAFNGGGLVTVSAPTGVMTVRPASSRQAPPPYAATGEQGGEWSIQVWRLHGPGTIQRRDRRGTSPRRESPSGIPAVDHAGAERTALPCPPARTLSRCRRGGLRDAERIRFGLCRRAARTLSAQPSSVRNRNSRRHAAVHPRRSRRMALASNNSSGPAAVV
jgi:transglycosylase-like protein with SLT domain